MSLRINRPVRETVTRIEEAIREALDVVELTVSGQGGHFEIRVVSAAFDGESRINKKRLVLRAIAPLMDGENAPVHAVDRLVTLTPDEARAQE